jgi:hypothetical protein
MGRRRRRGEVAKKNRDKRSRKRRRKRRGRRQKKAESKKLKAGQINWTSTLSFHVTECIPCFVRKKRGEKERKRKTQDLLNENVFGSVLIQRMCYWSEARP